MRHRADCRGLDLSSKRKPRRTAKHDVSEELFNLIKVTEFDLQLGEESFGYEWSLHSLTSSVAGLEPTSGVPRFTGSSLPSLRIVEDRSTSPLTNLYG